MTTFLHTVQKELSRGWRLIYLFVAFVIAVLYDVLLFDVPKGLGFLVFICVSSLLFTFVCFQTKHIKQPLAFLFLIPAIVLASDVVLYSNALVTYLVPWISFFFMLLFFAVLPMKNPSKHAFSLSRIPLFSRMGGSIGKWVAVWRDITMQKETHTNRLYKKIILSFVIATPILVVFGMLFAKADPIFAQLVDNLFDVDVNGLLVWRIVRTVVFTMWLGGVFYFLVDASYALSEQKIRTIKIDPVISTIVLGLVNLLFLIFVFIQVSYIFSSRAMVLESGVSFAEYARSGFFQLVWVVIIAALLIMFFYKTYAHQLEKNKFISLLKVLLLFQVGIVAVSALKRMNLYQAEFGYTVLRLYVEWFIYFCLLLLLFTALCIIFRIKFKVYVHSCLVAGTLAFLLVASLNVDGMIARENVDRYLYRAESTPLDMVYLIGDLSVDAIPHAERALASGYDLVGTDSGYKPAVYGALSERDVLVRRVNARLSSELDFPSDGKADIHFSEIIERIKQQEKNTRKDWRSYKVILNKL